jgi:SAM-dependent methyltransferase
MTLERLLATLLRVNVGTFGNVDDCDYLLRKEHQLRGDVSIGLLAEVADAGREPRQKILSIACSIGILEERMKERLRLAVYGIDAAKEALQRAQRRGIITQCADVSRPLPFAAGSFDFVFAGEILEHIFDTRAFLCEVHRVLKPEGYVVITTPNLARFDDRLKLLFGKTPRQTSPLHPHLFLHIRPFTFYSLKNALELCGFSEIVLRTDVFRAELFGRDIFWCPKLLIGLFPTLGSTLIVRARRTATSHSE